jgi:hypothetical protein
MKDPDQRGQLKEQRNVPGERVAFAISAADEVIE